MIQIEEEIGVLRMLIEKRFDSCVDILKPSKELIELILFKEKWERKLK